MGRSITWAQRVLERATQPAAAIDAYLRARCGELPQHLRAVLLTRLGALARKLGRRDLAREVFAELRQVMPASYRPEFELARLCERTDPGSAVAHLDAAIAKLEQSVAMAERARARELGELGRRRERLLRRLARALD
ncbi:MAG: hypothetical protein U1E76_00010 [Planctomycetota bacterium]